MTETLAELHAEGWEANRRTAEEIVARLEALGNYIPPDLVVRNQYRNRLLEKFEEHVANKRGD